MQARMKNPLFVVPEALKALHALNASTQGAGVPRRTLGLVHMRASQINGCAGCLDMHAREMLKEGETPERLSVMAAWREAPCFDAAERAALALTEALTRIADRPESVSDEIWNEAARHYDERALAALVLQIAQINTFNRVNVAVRQIAGFAGNGS